MATFTMDDGKIVKTENAVEKWKEDTFWDGRNHISKATGDQWVHETLYLSRKGNFYIVTSSQCQGSRDRAEWIDDEGAAKWIIANERDLPEQLLQYEEQFVE